MEKSDYYNLARETAKIIHEFSWEENGVLQVMLYGSTLHHNQPKDIDLLVIHNGNNLAPYFRYTTLQVDTPPEENNARMPPYSFLKKLGYKEGSCDDNSVLTNIQALISPRNVNNLYDLNALDIILLADENGFINGVDMTNGRYDFMRKNNRFDLVQEVIQRKREEAIQSCRETNFWYTILSEGKIYDKNSNDFSIKTSELYSESLKLFPSTPDTSHRRGGMLIHF